VPIVTLRKHQGGRYYRVSACHIVRGYISTSSAAFVDSQSSSQSSGGSPSDSESVDLAAISSAFKRKATLPLMGSQRPQKIARTDASHHLGRSTKETEATSRTQGSPESRSTTTSPISTKRRKVLLPRNRGPLPSLIPPRTGTFAISSRSGCQCILVPS
jgi:hypothetical protein